MTEHEDLLLASKEWSRLQEKSIKEGYREGISQAEDDSLQTGFDEGYKSSFIRGKMFGEIRGLIASKKIMLQDDPDKTALLDIVTEDLNLCDSFFRSQDTNETDDNLEEKLRKSGLKTLNQLTEVLQTM